MSEIDNLQKAEGEQEIKKEAHTEVSNQEVADSPISNTETSEKETEQQQNEVEANTDSTKAKDHTVDKPEAHDNGEVLGETEASNAKNTEDVDTSEKETEQQQNEVEVNTNSAKAEDHTVDKPEAHDNGEVLGETETSNAENTEDAHTSEKETEQQQNEVEANTDSTKAEDNTGDKSEAQNDDEVLDEIEASNAEDAEDEGNKDRHTIEVKEYDKMSLEALAIELERLLRNEKVQAIRSHVQHINNEFKSKFQALIDEKKTEFINDGGNEIDFYYSSPVQKRYKQAYKEYRHKLNEHYQNLEKNLKQNLAEKLEIIEELKGLINVEENINTTYKHFKELQERWRNTGPIPRDKYNNAWNSYHHHVEMFYDFLHLNRDLRDLDFKHNLEKKLKIIERAEALAKEDDILYAFRELQELHKMWKEELGPVAKEHRESIWERFKIATKEINDKRQLYFKEIDKIYEKNLEKKEEIIAKISAIADENINSHNGWQKKIKEVEALREAFFNAGKVPLKVNEATWAKFKEVVRNFNRKKNAFYKDLKKDQYNNLQKKLELIKIAEDNKDSEDFETVTPLMKKIQSDWKKIGHVPRKDSDKIWKRFKKACNYYFDRIHANKNAANKQELEAFSKKQEMLDTLKSIEISGDKTKDLETINEQISIWKAIGRVPYDKRYIEGKFYKALDSLFLDLKMDKSEIEMIKFENKLEQLNNEDNSKHLDNERAFISKKITEVKSQINQLENNLQFFTNVDDDNPLVKEVHSNIKKHKEELKLWKKKFKKIKELY
ncbi:DUF349 domain-containing protein [Aestuariivivens insulae]|uniref:DUF349 domain-containing protein n=1 Tax=Aestuariivivens insulae TaxID=1621988 RepID=UPI001F5AFA8A|nr:DUF349 domain-containing protein [Aestuariivivens insulae]